jgi:hypothetical protein
VVNQPLVDEKSEAAPRSAYEKPTLQRLGLLRLMTRYSIAGGDENGNHGGNHNHKHEG